MRAGITVREAMELPSLRPARVVAGAGGLDRAIRSVNVMEVPDILPFVKADELLLTTAYPLREDPGALVGLIGPLSERGLAAVAVVPRPYLGKLPAGALALADALAFPLIELPDGAAFDEIMADVLEPILDRQAVQLERSQAIHERLTAVVLGGGSFAELLRTLADLLQRHVQIVDAHGRSLAEAGASTPHVSGDGRTVRPVRVGGTKLGEIVIHAPPEELRPEDLMAMDQAATIAALQMAQARAVLTRERRYQAVLLDELVSGHPIAMDRTIEHAAALGWDLRIPRTAIVVELRDAASGEEVLVAGRPLEDRSLQAVAPVLRPADIVWARRSGVAALIGPGIDPGAAGKRIRDELRRLMPDLRVQVGIGRQRSDASELHASYTEALRALAVGARLGGDVVLSYRDLGVDRLLHRLASDGELQSYCADLLDPLLEHDRAKNGALTATLECYLRHDRNAAATARDLAIHYNTLRYRLKRIDDLIGGLDRDPNARLSLEVALRAWRLLTAGASDPAQPMPARASSRGSSSAARAHVAAGSRRVGTEARTRI